MQIDHFDYSISVDAYTAAMAFLVWTLIVAASAITVIMFVVGRRSTSAPGTSSADQARRGQSTVEADAHLNDLRGQSGPP